MPAEGYYLAGLIKGDGYIGERRIEIAFHKDDISSANYIKRRKAYRIIQRKELWMD